MCIRDSVFMGHGTSHTAKVSYSQMQTTMQTLGYDNVFIDVYKRQGGTSPAGELQSSAHNANLIAPYASEKIAYGVQITCRVLTVYGNPKYKR